MTRQHDQFASSGVRVGLKLGCIRFVARANGSRDKERELVGAFNVGCDIGRKKIARKKNLKTHIIYF